MRWLPKRIPVANSAGEGTAGIRWYRIRDFGIAVAGGAEIAVLAYAIMIRPQPDGISWFFAENALSEGGGTNIVNVILVDFRGFDTFGEITVLEVVALTVYALLRRFRPAAESIPIPEQQRSQNEYDDASRDRRKGDTVRSTMAIPALMMALLFPVIGTMAMFLFLRGHDLPGGGFVAGLTMALAFILQYMARGTIWVEGRLRILPVRWMGAGLLLAAAVGAAAWGAGRPFLSSYFLLHLPVLARHLCEHAAVRSGRIRARGWRDRSDVGCDRPSVGAKPSHPTGPRCRTCRRQPSGGGGGLMEIVLALGIGALAASGVWLILRPRTFQVIIGLSLLSYAVNLFIVAMGRLGGGAPIVGASPVGGLTTDPLPQALVLTAIVISFATTALFLVVLLASRGLTGTDHVDGRDPKL